MFFSSKVPSKEVLSTPAFFKRSTFLHQIYIKIWLQGIPLPNHAGNVLRGSFALEVWLLFPFPLSHLLSLACLFPFPRADGFFFFFLVWQEGGVWMCVWMCVSNIRDSWVQANQVPISHGLPKQAGEIGLKWGWMEGWQLRGHCFVQPAPETRIKMHISAPVASGGVLHFPRVKSPSYKVRSESLSDPELGDYWIPIRNFPVWIVTG